MAAPTARELTRRKRPWLAMAVLAVLSLGTTVFVAQRAVTDASDVVVRGESDLLMSAVVGDLSGEAMPLSSADLESELAAQHDAGLRYIALSRREGTLVAEAGSPKMRGVLPRPGQSELLGERVRVAGPLLGPHAHHAPRFADGLAPPPPGGGPILVLEFEPPVIQNLRADLTRISIVAAVAGIVLLAFALAWSRSAARLSLVEQKAARDERLVALGSMSSVMAHELRNPLASLKGHAQLLVEDLSDSEEARDASDASHAKKLAKAERVVREAERLEVLTSSLLDFVRDGPIERTPIAPTDLVARALDHVTPERVSRVKVDLTAAPPELFVDGPRLARALHNLIDNALQATSGAENVDLSIAAEGEGARTGTEVVIEVRDRGPGIPSQADSKIFEPFHTTRVRGTGLGLPVARRIAEQHGGQLKGSNRPDGGALFRLRFPNHAS